MAGQLSAEEVARVAEFRASLRRFLRRSERNARAAGLTPQRYLLLLMIKGAADHSEQSTVTELAERLQLAQSTVTELVRRRTDCLPAPDARGRTAAGGDVHEQRGRAADAPGCVRQPPGARHRWLG